HPRLYDVLREYFHQDTAARFKRPPQRAASGGSSPNAGAGATALAPPLPPPGFGRVHAQFVRKSDGKPISGASGQYSVKLFDKDLLQDDELGEPRLDAAGRVQCTFDLHDIVSVDSPFESKPDLYLVLYERGHEVFRTPVFWNLEFEKSDPASGTKEPVAHDLGTFAV
ncbi:MAG TPA: hypothetical protein VKE94_08545, partial [Gemmataceae bacterium]|nr:hypothetical protein [Gemmataceae bacterium]